MRGDYVEAVLDVAAAIPPARVLSYGDIAEILGAGGPRQVGAVLSRCGSDVPWWRVVRASGLPPEGHGLEAWRHYREERTALKGTPDDAGQGYRVDMRQARWTPGVRDMEALEAIAAKMSEGIAELEP
jgi:alkylated DNA nucleotide flippase Atl1